MKKLISFSPAIFWFIICTWLFLLPGSEIPKVDWFHVMNGDKLVHCFLLFWMCFLFMLPFKENAKKNAWYFTITTLFVFYGIAIEFIQRDYIPNRSFDIGDIYADTTGCIIALVVVIKKIGFGRNRNRNQN